jgi:hypothetical protein
VNAGGAAAVAAILDRELRALRRELEAYPDDQAIWHELPGVPNSAGTLALHLAGNLQHYIGARLAGSGYVRDRDAEFARRGVPRTELLAEIERARTAVQAGLGALEPAALDRDYPEAIAQSRVRTGDYLVHLCTHFAYHLGQVDVHRRVVTGAAVGIGAVRPAELWSARSATP